MQGAKSVDSTWEGDQNIPQNVKNIWSKLNGRWKNHSTPIVCSIISPMKGLQPARKKLAIQDFVPISHVRAFA